MARKRPARSSATSVATRVAARSVANRRTLCRIRGLPARTSRSGREAGSTSLSSLTRPSGNARPSSGTKTGESGQCSGGGRRSLFLTLLQPFLTLLPLLLALLQALLLQLALGGAGGTELSGD